MGAKTGKVLFVASRNKYCPICSRAASKNITVREHNCFRNWKGSSTSKETDIILEGFKQSIEMHKLKYVRLVGDGDSSVYKKISVEKPYGSRVAVKKIECTNHLLRNYCSKLRDLTTKRLSSSNKLVSPQLRKLLLSNIERLRIGIRTAINYRRKEEKSLNQQMELLVNDIKNCPNHVFGKHNTCSTYFCKGAKEKEINYIPKMQECGLLEDIFSCGNRLIQNVYSLLLNMNNNSAETYNSVVSKFVGGKRINFSIKSSYDIRCRAAALSYNRKEESVADIHRTMTTRSPGKYTQMYIERQKRKRELRSVRRTILPSKKRKRIHAPADEDYGLQEVTAADVSFTEKNKNDFIVSLKKTAEEIVNIEQLTRGQSRNPLWIERRRNLLTASNFGAVCKLRKTTNPIKLVKSILEPTFTGSVATRWGCDHEDIAKKAFESLYHLKVNNCGLFLSEDYPFLGASPDGVISNDSIIEIKCPYSAAKLTPEQAVNEKKIKYLHQIEGQWKLKQKDSYYYQVQGQLAITKRQYCYFVVWSPLGVIVDKVMIKLRKDVVPILNSFSICILQIERNEQFWNAIVPKLQAFYLDSMLPEILKQC